MPRFTWARRMIWSPSKLTRISGCWRRPLAAALRIKVVDGRLGRLLQHLAEGHQVGNIHLRRLGNGGISSREVYIRWATTFRIPVSLETVSPSISSSPVLLTGLAAGRASAARQGQP